MLPAHDRGVPEEAEHLLWRAAFNLFLFDVVRGNERERDNALRWCRESSADIGGFAWCCELLGFSATAVRKSILAGNVKLTRKGSPPAKTPPALVEPPPIP
jgi:hypothetical protein